MRHRREQLEPLLSLGTSPGRALSRNTQLNVPGSPDIGAPIGMPEGIDIPPSQQGDGLQAGPHGSQTGPQGAAMGCGQVSPRPHGERNSMNDGRRQLLPMQLLQPGAAARAARASTRHPNRTMINLSMTPLRPSGCSRRLSQWCRPRRRHQKRSSRIVARSATGAGTLPVK